MYNFNILVINGSIMKIIIRKIFIIFTLFHNIFIYIYNTILLQIVVALLVHAVSAQLQLSAGISGNATVRYGTHNITATEGQNIPSARTNGLRFPDPLSCSAYYLLKSLSSSTIVHMTCPNGLIFKQSIRACVSDNGCDVPAIRPIVLSSSGDCSGFGFACINQNSFKYCANVNTPILEYKSCPRNHICLMHKTNPCHPYISMLP